VEAIVDLLEGKDSEKTGEDANKGAESDTAAADSTKDADDSQAADGSEEETVEEGQVVVSEAMMQSWIASLERFTPKQ